jgi:hypothetical protein
MERLDHVEGGGKSSTNRERPGSRAFGRDNGLNSESVQIFLRVSRLRPEQ